MDVLAFERQLHTTCYEVASYCDSVACNPAYLQLFDRHAHCHQWGSGFNVHDLQQVFV